MHDTTYERDPVSNVPSGKVEQAVESPYDHQSYTSTLTLTDPVLHTYLLEPGPGLDLREQVALSTPLIHMYIPKNLVPSISNLYQMTWCSILSITFLSLAPAWICESRSPLAGAAALGLAGAPPPSSAHMK
jgi:hypothetical protein